ncbi:type IX secretion system motor protein PorM/GldM [Pararcticibacter amylolyticus]|uniref:Gliding motility protein GldM n=1 Tax=Pararcticibacter amylolyticus TaxID=2173175 RepID=A0A2U2PCC7_9SPHI|nr:gliding motility protein GldM [Pararcticibacter amylolyticus]PWG78779.1 gliding motility protein GldM [Pararcticibacter amylolyticus]
MAGGKETTRQRMINIMYLVLLAMLALNVSDTILNAFKNINDSLELSKTNVNTGVEQLFAAFESTKLKDEPVRAKPVYEKAKEAQKIAGELNDYIESIKKEFVTQGQGIDPETGDLKARDNLDIAPGIMVNQKQGEKLKSRINETREKLMALLEEKDRATVSLALSAEDPKQSLGGKKTWEEVNFGEGTPLTAAMTILTKIQTDVKNAEADVVKRILGKMDQAVVNLDKFAAVAVAPTSYLIQGQPYTAEVFLTAYDSRSNPTISVGGSSLPVRDGKGVYTIATNREGMFSWTGKVRVMQTDGTVKEYTTPEQKYQVARPSAVVSPDKMNVFYIGVDNPVSVSAPGIPKENLRVTMNGGSIGGSNGKYTVKVSSPGQATVNVAAEIAPGKVQTIGTTQFRVKRIPDPVARFGGKTGGTLSSVAIKAQNNVFAVLEGFDFDAKFSVTRFSVIIAKPRADAIVLQTSGNSLSGAMKSALAGIGPGTRVIFDNIIAVGPDGSQRALNSIALTAN